MPKAKEYFDFESIDTVSHRLGEIPTSKGRELKKIYKQDKKQFYDELETIIPEEKVLSHMLQQINFLPFISNDRKLVFRELNDLYRADKWFGFYALGLTQIEGLFADMCRICQPKYNSPYDSLPDKVHTVRPYYPYSDNRFDYYQYYLPNLRNRFLHYGFDGTEKIEILCKELLYDLEGVVHFFAGLDIDANWLLRMIRKRDSVDFIGAGRLCFYFRLLAGVKQKKQFKYFEDEVKSLNELFLPDIVYNVVFDLDSRIEELIEKIYEPVRGQSTNNGFPVDLKAIAFRDIANNKTKIKPALKEAFTWQFQSEIEELLQILRFIKSYKQYLDLSFIATEVLATIDMLDTRYNDILTRIKLIALVTEFKLEKY